MNLRADDGGGQQALQQDADTVDCLVVDDLEENLVALTAVLSRPGVRVLAARSAEAALEILFANEVALAFLDVHMPNMDGFELAEIMRANDRTKDIPLVFVTAAHSDRVWTFRGYDLGAVDFLYKPLDPRIIRNKANVFFQLHRQKRQLALQLAQRSRELRWQETFNAILGHDLRNPLNAMLMSAHLIQRQATEPLLKDAAERIQSSGRRMANLIEDLLDLARLRATNGIVLSRSTVDLGQLVRRIVAEHRSASPGRELRLQATGDLVGHWDAGRLGQVFSNLVGNALKHGSLNMPIDIEVDGTAAQEVVVVVRNAGSIDGAAATPRPTDSGVPRDTGARGDGLGLGLLIVRGWTEAHGGHFRIGNGADGTVVAELRLPRVASERSRES